MVPVFGCWCCSRTNCLKLEERSSLGAGIAKKWLTDNYGSPFIGGGCWWHSLREEDQRERSKDNKGGGGVKELKGQMVGVTLL